MYKPSAPLLSVATAIEKVPLYRPDIAVSELEPFISPKGSGIKYPTALFEIHYLLFREDLSQDGLRPLPALTLLLHSSCPTRSSEEPWQCYWTW